MNFEELKNNWQKESAEEVHIPSRIAQLKEARHPLEQLQKNMKKEFYAQVAAILLIALLPFQFGFPAEQYIIYYTSYAMLVVISAYYIFGFYRFYRQVGLYNGDTRSSLWKIYYELRLNMERYQSFGFLLLPHFLITLGLAVFNKMAQKGKTLADLTEAHQFSLIIIVLVGTLAVVAGIVLWVKYVYGRYAKKIEHLLKEMTEEE